MGIQLKMIYEAARNQRPEVPKLPAGFVMRNLDAAREMDAYKQLRQATGFGGCNSDKCINYILETIYDDGLYVIEEKATGRIVASACAQRGYYHGYANLGWVMADPDYRGRAFGKIVSLQALACGLDHGAPGMTLTTDDFREAALRIYLKYGWRPWIFTEDDNMRQRWTAIAEKLAMPQATDIYDVPFDISGVQM